MTTAQKSPDVNDEGTVRLSIVVPCYNEEDSLRHLYDRVTNICINLNSIAGDYEIVLIDDGSADGTWAIIKDLVSRDPHVVGVRLSRNHGHQKALTAGLTLCSGERILILDADLQDPPELLPKMMNAMDDGAEIVYGQRSRRDGETWLKLKTASVFYRLLSRLSDVEIPIDTGDFRLISRRALDVLNSMPEEHRFVRGMVSWIGMRQVPILYERNERHAGETKYTFSKMVRFALDAITGFSIVPLRLASLLGFVFGLGGLLLLVYVFAGWFSGNTVPGWTSLAVIVLFIGSSQLIVLGVIGEYLGRLYISAKRRPLFVVDEVIRNK